VRFSLDTNILVYAFDSADTHRHAMARDVVARAARRDCVVALQALAETFHVLTRKGRASAALAGRYVDRLADQFDVVHADMNCLRAAMSLVRQHKVGSWDALLLATIAAVGCRLLLTEDMQDARRIAGLSIVNPFNGRSSPLVAEAIGDLGGT
jgi:predicted nucleic acid-binding protein